jgi:hypothetical protein
LIRRNLYPKADILSQREHWDDATREVVLDRVRNVPAFEHFDEHAQRTLEALCERVIPQADLPADRRVPIAPWIDQRYGTVSPEGFQFEDMPPNKEAWDQGLAGLDQSANTLFGRNFADLDAPRQDDVLRAVRRGDPPGEAWQKMPAQRWWIYVALRQISGVYYAHPSAWDEIGFGGPAYPRGYFALSEGTPEPWEPREVGEDGAGK